MILILYLWWKYRNNFIEGVWDKDPDTNHGVDSIIFYFNDGEVDISMISDDELIYDKVMPYKIGFNTITFDSDDLPFPSTLSLDLNIGDGHMTLSHDEKIYASLFKNYSASYVAKSIKDS